MTKKNLEFMILYVFQIGFQLFVAHLHQVGQLVGELPRVEADVRQLGDFLLQVRVEALAVTKEFGELGERVVVDVEVDVTV
jgi:hypothetical protein